MQFLQIKTSTARIAARITATDIGGTGIDTETTTTMTIVAGTGLPNMTATNFAVGMPKTIDTSLRVWPRETACRRGLRGSLFFAARFRQAWESRVVFVPVELERRLPPPPPDCERIAIGGHIVLRNRNTKIVVDIFHFE